MRMITHPTSDHTLFASTVAVTGCFAFWTISPVIGIPFRQDIELSGVQFGLLSSTLNLTADSVLAPFRPVANGWHAIAQSWAGDHVVEERVAGRLMPDVHPKIRRQQAEKIAAGKAWSVSAHKGGRPHDIARAKTVRSPSRKIVE